MRRNSLKRIWAICAGVLAVALVLTGCAAFPAAFPNENGITLRVSMYNDIAYSDWRTYVASQCPDITLVWENNRDSTQNLIYQARHGDMADLVMIRSFENDSAADLAPYLADLGGDALTATFVRGSLEPFTFNGKLCWYPAPGMMEVLYANVSLFARAGMTLPETVAQMQDVCRRFSEAGLDALSIDAAVGYRCAYLLEGFNYAAHYTQGDGAAWMQAILAGKKAVMSEDTGTRLASMLRDFTQDHVLERVDLTAGMADTRNAFDSENAAMFAFDSDITYQGKTGSDYQVIPCLGETPEDRILYTYPVFSTAVSEEAAADSAKKDAIDQVLQVMYSSEAQQILAQDTDALLSYNEGIDLPVSHQFASVADLIGEKKCFIRFLNRNSFSAYASAVKDIVEDGVSDGQFSADLNEAMNRPLDTSVIGSSDIHAGNLLGEDFPLERSAASVIAQTVRSAVGSDVALVDGKAAAAPLYEGDYTQSDLNAAVADENLYTGELTGAQVQDIFDDVIWATTTYQYHMIEPLVDYPALAGMKAHLSSDGSHSLLLLPDGTGLDPSASYTVVISQNVQFALSYLQNENVNRFIPIGATLQTTLRDQLATGSLPSAEAYFEVEAPQ